MKGQFGKSWCKWIGVNGYMDINFMEVGRVGVGVIHCHVVLRTVMTFKVT